MDTKIIDLKVNHIKNPVGYDLGTQSFTWKYETETPAHMRSEDFLSEGPKDHLDRTKRDGNLRAVSQLNNSEIKAKASRVSVSEQEDFGELFWDSGFDGQLFRKEAALELKPRTRYFWRVEVMLEGGCLLTSETAFFETGKLKEPWIGKWLGVDGKDRGGILVRGTFPVSGKVRRARAYVTGLGLYECYLNQVYQNDGYLQPGFNNYNLWMQYQTIDVTESIRQGENVLGFLLGAGWYRGRFGVNGGYENNFGSKDHLLAELHIEYEDGREEVFGTDESFRYSEGPVRFANIYDGEVFDASFAWIGRIDSGLQDPEQPDVGRTDSYQQDSKRRGAEQSDSFQTDLQQSDLQQSVLEQSNLAETAPAVDAWMLPGFDDSGWHAMPLAKPERMATLTERFSLPVVVKERRKPMALLTGPDGEKILDMGQNMTGWLIFRDTLQKGQKVILRFAEHMEDGKLCRKNLLTAKQEFVYISDHTQEIVRPHFTYFGFRYVELEGFPETVSADDFEGWCLYSDMETAGELTTGNELVNQFIHNTYWSQRDNFLEHPTDCPQRSERLGWTGDAQIYCQTACYFMDTAAFYRKYMKDVNEEQRKKNGQVPFIVPKINAPGFENSTEKDECSAAWSDVATILPWTLYLNYGDKNLLAEEYDGMKAWVDYMIKQDVEAYSHKSLEDGQDSCLKVASQMDKSEEDGGCGLWQSGFHFGDWLALDNPEPGPFGKTDPFYIASCYYFYSTTLLAKAAKVLEKADDLEKYRKQAAKIRAAIRKTYLDEKGICTQGTQTGYVLAIYMDITSAKEKSANGRCLAEAIRRNGGHLDTGFVGTPYLCRALTLSGFHQDAVSLLLQEEYPGWLYQVKKGATTVWEAWDALGEDGKLTGEASLNHYAFGSVTGWMFSDLCGIQPVEEHPGYEVVRMQPHPDPRIGSASASVNSPCGTYQLSWSYEQENSVKIVASVPCFGKAELILPEGKQTLEAGCHVFLVRGDLF
ncbi:MAG: glycoside hydrolase family 78 protein [Lachnospiraceae bacterium]|nr:glycoside hydrolase family 78 protein [Lachnospiraceae bacterium]